MCMAKYIQSLNDAIFKNYLKEARGKLTINRITKC